MNDEEQRLLASIITTYRFSNQPDKAIALCRQAASRFPDSSFFPKLEGDISRQYNRFPQAAQAYLNMLVLLHPNQFSVFATAYRNFKASAPEEVMKSFLENIRELLNGTCLSKELSKKLYTLLGSQLAVDQELLQLAELALAMIEKTQKPYQNKLILATMLRICRKKEDYTFVEKELQINDAFIDISDFNLQYELVYYFQTKGSHEGLEKTLRRMRDSAVSSIPIARTLYNFYLSLNRFEGAQTIYVHIQQLEQNHASEHDPHRKGRIRPALTRSEEQMESEQAV